MSVATGELSAAAAFGLSEAGSPLTELQKAILLTVHYRDLFRHAISEPELHTYLIGKPASRDAVRTALDGLTGDCLSITNGLTTWRGQEHLVEERHRRLAISETLWEHARSYARVIRRIPFLRMAGVSGSLAVRHAQQHHDIDIFCIAETGRVWVVMFFLRILRTYSRRYLPVPLCPNTCLAEDSLEVSDRNRNLYMAHQIAHLVPLWGHSGYQRFLDANRWVNRFLPNALQKSKVPLMSDRGRLISQACEAVTPAPLGDALNRHICRLAYRKAIRFYGDTHPEVAIRSARNITRYMLPGQGYTSTVLRRFLNGHATRFAGIMTEQEMAEIFGATRDQLHHDQRLETQFEAKYGRIGKS